MSTFTVTTNGPVSSDGANMKNKKQKSYKELGDTTAETGITGAPLTHTETRRATALSLACKYYVETIVKDGELYREMMRDNRVLKPATYMAVIEVAFNFEAFLSGEIQKDLQAIIEEVKPIAEAKKEMEKEQDKPIP